METTYDTIIIGGACAGLAAGTYAARRSMKTLIITKDIGGQIATTSTVENYPAIDEISGPDLANDMMNQAVKWGSELVYDEVTKIEKVGEKQFTVTTNKSVCTGKSVILAYGKTPRSLDVPGEKEYTGHGVCYCVTCDAPLYRNRTVAVIGGGNSAMEGALLLAKQCAKVYIIHQKDALRGENILVEQVTNDQKIEKVFNANTTEILGDGKFVTGLKYNDATGTSQEIQVEGVFIEIGFVVKSDLIKELVELDRLNQVVTNKRMETSTPGIFACGDITDSPYKQAVISAGEGASAALTAYSYVFETPNIGVDWTGK